MNKIGFPYGKNVIEYDFSNEKFLGSLTSSIHGYEPAEQGIELIKTAMRNPIGSPSLFELAKGKKKIVLIASDHTRPVPSKVIVPPMLEEIRAAEPDAEITILIATGCHRNTTREELVAKFGEEIVDHERIEIHISTDDDAMVHLGTLPSGGEIGRAHV